MFWNIIIWVSTFIAFAQKLPINVYVDAFKAAAIGQNFDLSIYLHPYIEYESSICSGGSTHMRRRACPHSLTR